MSQRTNKALFSRIINAMEPTQHNNENNSESEAEDEDEEMLDLSQLSPVNYTQYLKLDSIEEQYQDFCWSRFNLAQLRFTSAVQASSSSDLQASTAQACSSHPKLQPDAILNLLSLASPVTKQ